MLSLRGPGRGIGARDHTADLATVEPARLDELLGVDRDLFSHRGQGCETRLRTRPPRLADDEWQGSRYDADCDLKVQRDMAQTRPWKRVACEVKLVFPLEEPNR